MLAMRLFGNGHGMAAPFFDQAFYWLNDTTTGRGDGRGRFYTWIGGLGAQLQSFEWRCPRPGTRRVLAGYIFEAFNVSRGRFGLMWSASWALVDLPAHDINAAWGKITELKLLLGSAS